MICLTIIFEKTIGTLNKKYHIVTIISTSSGISPLSKSLLLYHSMNSFHEINTIHRRTVDDYLFKSWDGNSDLINPLTQKQFQIDVFDLSRRSFVPLKN